MLLNKGLRRLQTFKFNVHSLYRNYSIEAAQNGDEIPKVSDNEQIDRKIKSPAGKPYQDLVFKGRQVVLKCIFCVIFFAK